MDIIGQAKEVADLVKKYNDIELYQKIVDLRDEIFQLREENLSLKEQLRESRMVDTIQPQLRRDGNVYWRTDERGHKSGPFCMACWDGDRKLVNVITWEAGWGQSMKCGRCAKGGDPV